MNVLPGQVRAAANAAAQVIRADMLPPLQLDESPAWTELPRRTRPAWFAPLAAAAAVVLVVVGSLTAGSWLARSGHSGKPGSTGNAPASAPAPAGAFAGVPAYYVQVASQSQAVVRATATGATLATIPASTPFVGVAGAADDRTFVLDAQRQVMGPQVTWPDPPQFYLLRLTAAGAQESFTKLTLPALPNGVAVTGLALTPDGSKLAVAMIKKGLMAIRVYTLATGAFREWSTHNSSNAVDPGGFTGSGVDGSQTISFAADARTLAFDWTDSSNWLTTTKIGVRLLDTEAAGADLIAASRIAVIEQTLRSQSGPGPRPTAANHYESTCVTDAIISGDGASIVCGYNTGDGKVSVTGFIRYSTSTGKQTGILGVIIVHGNGPGGDISLKWVDSTGNILIGTVGTPHAMQTGVINGNKFTPLPGVRDLNTAAW